MNEVRAYVLMFMKGVNAITCAGFAVVVEEGLTRLVKNCRLAMHVSTCHVTSNSEFLQPKAYTALHAQITRGKLRPKLPKFCYSISAVLICVHIVAMHVQKYYSIYAHTRNKPLGSAPPGLPPPSQ